MSRSQGADELRIRALLRQNGVGPNPIPPKPTGRPRDWLDDILNSPPPRPTTPAVPPVAQPATPPEPKQITTAKPKKKRKKKTKKPTATAPRAAFDTQVSDPRQSLLDAWQGIPPRIKWLGYHASAAFLGWTTGLVSWATYVTAWIAATGFLGVQPVFWYCAAAATFLLYRRTRGWWLPVAWLAAVPACSTVVGVLLYAPTQ